MKGLPMMAVAILCSAAASYCLKLGAAGAPRSLLAMALQPTMLGAMALYAGSFGAYAIALQKIPLTLAQPAMTAGASLLTALVAVLVLGESMSMANWCGLLLVAAGIMLLSAGKF